MKTDRYELQRIRLEEIETLKVVIDCCKDVLQNPICLEQAQDAKEELDLAVQEMNKLIMEIAQ